MEIMLREERDGIFCYGHSQIERIKSPLSLL